MQVLGRQADTVGLITVDPTLHWIVTASDRGRGFTLNDLDPSSGPIAVTRDLGRIYAASFTPDGAALVVSEGDMDDLVLWNVADLVAAPDGVPRSRLAGHEYPVVSLAVTSDEIVSADAASMRRWSLARGARRARPSRPLPSVVGGAGGSLLAVGVDGPDIVTVRGDGTRSAGTGWVGPPSRRA